MKLVNEKKSEALLMASVALLLLNFVWMGLEYLIYREVQHRLVDDIISFPIMYSFYLNALHYIEGRNRR